MEQENFLPETSFQQDSNIHKPSQHSSHTETTNMMIENLNSEDPSNMNLSQLLKDCQFKKALSLLEIEFDSKQASLGAFDIKLRLVPLLNQMAEIQIALADYPKASDLCHKSNQILQNSREDPDFPPLMAQTFQILALISRENQDYKEALEFINNSRALSSPNSLQMIEVHRIKALLLCDLQQYKEALEEIQRGFDIMNKSIDTIDQILVVRLFNTFGDIHSILHDWKTASKWFETGLEICQKYDLTSHLEMAKAGEGLVRCSIETKRVSPLALNIVESALKIYHNCFGEERHPARIPCFLLFIRCFKIQKDLSKVKHYVSLAVEEGEAFYGPDCEKMREVRLSAAKVCGNRQLKEVLVSPILQTSTVDKNGRELLNLYLQKCDACLICGEYQVFAFHFPEAVNAIKDIYGEKSLEIVKIYERIVVFFQATKQLRKMTEYLGKCVEVSKEILGENHIDIAKAYLTFSGIYSTQKNYSRATPYIEQALKIQAEFYGEAHPTVIETHVLLANAYGFNEELKKSLKTHLKILKIQEKSGDERIYETYESIGMLYSKFNDAKNSGDYFRKSYQMARAKLGINDERTLDTKEFTEFNAEEKDMYCNEQEF